MEEYKYLYGRTQISVELSGDFFRRKLPKLVESVELKGPVDDHTIDEHTCT